MSILKKPYTVLLLYPDYMNVTGHETYHCHVEAKTPKQAVFFAQFEASKANAECEDKKDFIALAVYDGHQTDINEVE